VTRETVVIVGASLAGGTAAFAVRASGFEGRLLLIGAEPHLPYGRPPLSKTYLRGEDGFEDWIVKPEAEYGSQGVETMLSTIVTLVDPHRHRVVLDGGEDIEYTRLVLATGGRNRTLPIPGHDLPGVLSLRTVEDADRIRETAGQSRGPRHAGRKDVYADIPSFWSDEYQDQIEYVVHHTLFDQVVIRGDTPLRP
jgi:3-phenylpropionate/trans-cinnamate dioxygenase ferredoxin reductase subunit